MYSGSLITKWQSRCWNFNVSLPPHIINISSKFKININVSKPVEFHAIEHNFNFSCYTPDNYVYHNR